jgi:polo-like kinase 1
MHCYLFLQLQAEIKIHRSLKHKHVCQYKHYFEDRNNCYILLELCHNQSLNEMIKRRKRLTEPEAAYFMRQLLEATRYMHEQNVIHRDLKLGNLFLDKDMQIKVGDLGLATRVEDKDEKRKTICGTPNYIAPEIIQGDKAKRGHSFEVDVWSMGVILYTILFGKPPYEAKDVKATYQRILNNEYSFPRHIDASEDAKTLIQSMLQSKPADRYDELINPQRIERALLSEPLTSAFSYEFRPTLDDIEANPFLVGRRMPTFLPTSVLSIAPTWRLDEFGDLVCSEEPRSRKPGIPLSNSGRQPFGSHEPNLRRAASTNTPGTRREKSGRDVINMERVVRTALAAMGSGGTSQTTTSVGAKKASSVASSSPGFKIFDESAGASYQGSSRGAKPPPAQRTVSASSVDFLAARDEGNAPHDTRSVVRSRPPPQMQSSPFALTEEALSARTRNLAISGPSPRNNSGTASSVFTHATSSVLTNTENEVDILQKMADHLDAVIEITESRRGTYRSTLPRPVSPRRAPGKWVTRYVDYTSKYGLGFLLNDGSSGVYFNDSTKTALEAHGEKFQYIERKKSADDGLPKRRGETTVETHTLASYPESLKKKVTLLKHFRNYLVEQQKKADEDDNSSPTDSDPFIGSDLVYVKKWVRTNHAILFCLSNRTVQAVFYDQTEILLTPDVAFLTYVDKNRRRSTYDFTDELVGSSPEIEKRLKYTKEILHQLLTGQRC